MFAKEVYWQRRKMLREMVGDGIILFPGNEESSMNYGANTYHFRQDSSFLYFFGINKPGFYGVCDVDGDQDRLYGDDFTIDDIIWMGEQPAVSDLAKEVAVESSASLNDLTAFLKQALQSGRKVHLLPTYRGDHVVKLAQLIGVDYEEVSKLISQELIASVVKLRSIKDQYEISEIEKAVDVARIMHTTAMKMAYPGNFERELAGAIEGIALSHGGPVSFPVILSMDGQTLHNHYHGNELTEGRMVVCDAGAETTMGYASDITRTYPVGGKFSTQQKDIYNIVLQANSETIKASLPGRPYREVHLMAARIIAGGLKELGIMKGDLDEAVAAGAHALFFPHGLGHMLGLDVHDMEGLGENNVGYSESLKRSDQFGLAYLRLGRELEPGFVVTNEPGCYFIPALIDQWKGEKKHSQFINYDQVEKYRGFGGVRIEDDVLITETGSRVLGTPIPKTVEEVEETMSV
ncbi:MAG: aminopeptidase P family protein [Bacteroidales bacterium]|nr:aminopeptidase P family protein [Bacteroidales bacterium]